MRKGLGASPFVTVSGMGGRSGEGGSTCYDSAAPAGCPSDKHTHFMNRKGKVVRVGVSSGIMAQKGGTGKATSGLVF